MDRPADGLRWTQPQGFKISARRTLSLLETQGTVIILYYKLDNFLVCRYCQEYFGFENIGSVVRPTLCSIDSDHAYPLCSTAHCSIVPMMHNMTSDCKMLTRLANRGQKGGKTGGGSAESRVVTVPLQDMFKKLSLGYVLFTVFIQRIFTNAHLKATHYLLRVS